MKQVALLSCKEKEQAIDQSEKLLEVVLGGQSAFTERPPKFVVVSMLQEAVAQVP